VHGLEHGTVASALNAGGLSHEGEPVGHNVTA
jgi:hypothetical protein